MEQDPAFENDNEYDEGFVRSGFVLIEEGIDANGDPAFRWRYTIDGPSALGLMQLLSDHVRAVSGPDPSDERD